jgi:ABC-type antimicrobial peptide transport system permease subunit
VERTADRLAAYRQVANTYLSTFQTLGSLGLLLGTVGLAVVLLRGLIERRSELALLSAIGFRPARRLALVLAENVTLLLVGLLAGTLCALVGVLPAVLSAGRTIRLSGLVAAMVAVLLSGLIVLTIAARLGGRRITPADLRHE